MSTPMPKFLESDLAFKAAIDEGRLTLDPKSTLFAAHWMYMGTINGKDQFKNIDTRGYLP